MNSDLRHILEAGIAAPSGENTQPWKFVVSGSIIRIFNRPEQDQSLYNWEQRASYIANGAAIENLTVAASHFGYQSDVQLFPDPKNQDHVATITLLKADPRPDPLYAYISSRTTNRKPYSNEPLREDELKAVYTAAHSPDVSLRVTQDETKKRILGLAGSTNEMVMLSNKELHQFFFSHVSWNKAQDDKKKVGFFIDTLELNPMARRSFLFIQHWPVMAILNKLGMYKIVGNQNGVSNSQVAGFGAIVGRDLSPRTCIYVGETLERVWLEVTHLGLSMQPLTGVLFFMQRVWAQDTGSFNKAQLAMIKKAYAHMSEAFHVQNGEKILFMFRIGRGEAPTARASRFAFDEIVTQV